MIDAQAAADRASGLDWAGVIVPARELDPLLARAHARLGIDLDDPPPSGAGAPTSAPRSPAASVSATGATYHGQGHMPKSFLALVVASARPGHRLRPVRQRRRPDP